MKINVKTQSGGYDIIFERGAIFKAYEYFNLARKVLIVTDSGVPNEYSQAVANGCKNAVVLSVPEGEKSKNFDSLQLILKTLTENNFTRTDCVAAVGGGMVGDLAGFAAATYLRGIDFYNIPTTVLSQVDSSVGGKNAINFMGYKNSVGAFYPPKAVIIDTDTLKTLPDRQISNGLCESVKMAVTSDKELFRIFEEKEITNEVLDDIIYRSVLIKKSVVEADEFEKDLRKVLNFGHTLAHAFESAYGMENYCHGECVAIGMLPMCSDGVRERLSAVLKKLNLPTKSGKTADDIIDACKHDKKMQGDKITVVTVEEIGKFEFKTLTFNEFQDMVRKAAL